VIRINARPGIALLFALTCVAGCAKGNRSDGDSSTQAASGQERNDSAAGNVDLRSTSYRPEALTAVGAVAGVVRLDGPIPADTAPTASGQPACDVATEPLNAPGRDQSNTVVWIADAKTGKSLPIDRRIEISTEHCEIDPRIQTAVVGSGINIINDDQLLHKLVFTRAGTNDTVAVMPFFNDGQVVASTALAQKPGVVEIRCTQHAWMHGFILVFDHPYYAVTSSDGSFKIDSLPPGTYKLMVWHEGAAKPLEKTIKVTAGGTTKADVQLAVEADR
jgi:Carboxypeptidase regulatory-like domain